MARIFLLVAAFVLCWTGTASAQSVLAAYPNSVASALQSLGYKANLTTDSSGDPMIKSAIDGVSYFIYFYGCEENTSCQDLQFSAGFNLNNGLSSRSMNDWNHNKLVGKASIDDEGDPFIRHFVSGVDGMSRWNFERTLNRWEVAVAEFKEHIDW